MKIAISSSGDTQKAKVDPRFGRCRFFLLYDESSGAYQAIGNSARSAGGGAGVKAAEAIVQNDAEALLTGNIGPKAFAVLRSSNVRVVTDVAGTVAEAVKMFLDRRYAEAEAPSVNAHHGLT